MTTESPAERRRAFDDALRQAARLVESAVAEAEQTIAIQLKSMGLEFPAPSEFSRQRSSTSPLNRAEVDEAVRRAEESMRKAAEIYEEAAENPAASTLGDTLDLDPAGLREGAAGATDELMHAATKSLNEAMTQLTRSANAGVPGVPDGEAARKEAKSARR